MPDLIVIGTSERIEEFEADENPADTFPCLFAGDIDAEARAHLYAILTRSFLDEAEQMEFYVRSLAEDGPYVYQLENTLIKELSYFPEDDIEQLASVWIESDTDLSLSVSELSDFAYQLVHFCQTVINEDDLHLYIISDG